MPPKPAPKQQEASPPPKQQQQQAVTQQKQQQQQQVVSQQKQPQQAQQAAPLKQAVSPLKTAASPPAKITQELPNKKGVTKEVIPPSPAVPVKVAETPTPKKVQHNYVAEKEQEMKEFKEKQDNYLKTLLSEVKGEDYCQESEATVEQTSKRIINRIAEGKLNLNSSPHRKIDAIEDGVIEKRILDAQKLKEQLKNQLSSVELRIDSLASQRIDNPKSLFSNPVFKHYLLGESEAKRKDAIKFIKRVQSEKSKFEAKLHALEEQKEQKRTMEIAEKERQLRNEQEEKEKGREERFKEKLQEIKKRQEARVRELKEFEESYIKKIKKDGQKKPLFQRYRKQFFLHEKEFRAKRLNEIKENKKEFLNVASIDFKEHQKQYFANLQKLETEKKQQREKEIAALIEKHPSPQIVIDSQKNFNKNESDGLTNEAEIEAKQKENAKKHAEARAKFSQGLKQHQQINESKEKRLEMEILIDKQINPEKYIVLIKKRTEAERYQQIQEKGKSMRKGSLDNSPTQSQSSAFKSRSSHKNHSVKILQSIDQLIFKEQSSKVSSFKRSEPGKEKELGDIYLKSIRESIREHRKKKQNEEKPSQIEATAISNGVVESASSQRDFDHNQLVLPRISLTENYTSKKAASSRESPVKREKTDIDRNLNSLENNQNYLTDKHQQRSLHNNTTDPSYGSKAGLNLDKRYSSRMRYEYYGQTSPLNSNQQTPVLQSKQFQKLDYMSEISQKFKLNERKPQWKELSEGQTTTLTPLSQQKILQDAYSRFDKDIRRKEQLVKVQQQDSLTEQEVTHRELLDQAYINSIQAKLAMIQLETENSQAQPYNLLSS